MDFENSSDVNIEVLPDSSASIGTSDNTDDKISANDNTSTQDAVPENDTSDFDAELDAEIEEAAKAKPEDQTEENYFRKLYREKSKEFKTFKKELSANSPTLTDEQQSALEMFEGLYAFDNQSNQYSAKPFAEKFVQKDVTTAKRAVDAVMHQPIPNHPDNWTIGHEWLYQQGIDPARLEEVRAFLNGETSAPVSLTGVPDFVPQDYAEAFNSYSQIVREDLEYRLTSDDEADRRGALEVLSAKQAEILRAKQETEAKEASAKRFEQEVENGVATRTTTEFNKFVGDFYETPTFKTAVLSGNELLDKAIKKSINNMILHLAEPDSVVGQHSLAFFKDLGVNVDTAKIQALVNNTLGSIETSVRAGKVNAREASARADSQITGAFQQLNAIRNRLFAEAINKLAGEAKQQSEKRSREIQSNRAVPTFDGDGAPKYSKRETVAEMIKRLSRTS